MAYSRVPRRLIRTFCTTRKEAELVLCASDFTVPLCIQGTVVIQESRRAIEQRGSQCHIPKMAEPTLVSLGSKKKILILAHNLVVSKIYAYSISLSELCHARPNRTHLQFIYQRLIPPVADGLISFFDDDVIPAMMMMMMSITFCAV